MLDRLASGMLVVGEYFILVVAWFENTDCRGSVLYSQGGDQKGMIELLGRITLTPKLALTNGVWGV